MDQTLSQRAHDASVDLKLTAKGQYHWEITLRMDVEGRRFSDFAVILADRLSAIDAAMRDTFPNNTTLEVK